MGCCCSQPEPRLLQNEGNGRATAYTINSDEPAAKKAAAEKAAVEDATDCARTLIAIPSRFSI